MFNALYKLASITALTVIGLVGLLAYRYHTAGATRIAALETQAAELKDVIGRLELERRVADLVVADQRPGPDGRRRTRLLMVEYLRDGRPLPPRSFEVVGEQVHIDALVVKYDAESIRRNDPLHGHALLLFEKIYGDAQVPADAQRLDVPGQVPGVYRDAADPKVGADEQRVWQQFWQLAGDAQLRAQYGIKVAHGAGVFAPLRPGVRYTVTLGADGNVTLYNEPLPAILSELLGK